MSQLFGMDLFHLNNRISQAETKKTDKTKNDTPLTGLSQKASSYYEELKAKFGDAEFVLVEDEQFAAAKERAANSESDKSIIVVISKSELEAMANNEDTRTQNEQIIGDAMKNIPEYKKQLEESGVNVKSFGIQLNADGTTSFFAIMAKSLETQDPDHKKEPVKKEDTTTVTASSLEELIKKLKDRSYEAKADNILTDQEKMVGQHLDLKF